MITELEERIFKASELAEWKSITPKTFSNNRKKYLEELKYYCDFEDLGKAGIKITKVKIPEYLGKAKTIVKKDFMEAWQDNPNSLKNAAHYIYKKNEPILTVKEQTVYQYTCNVKREWFGIPKKCRGVKGHCNWVYAVVDKENGKFRYLTEEEQEIKNKMIKEFFCDTITPRQLEEVKGLQESLKLGEITSEEYIQLSEETMHTTAADWAEFDVKFMTAIGENCNFALELIEEAWEEM